MIIEVFGRTDRRPVVYTLIKVLQMLGDVCLITDNPHYTRLTENNVRFGHCQNTAIFVTDTPADEVFEEIGHSPNDFDFVISDNKDFVDSACVFYVEGLAPEDADKDFLAAIKDVHTAKIGRGSAKIMAAIEEIEYYKMFKLVDESVTRAVVTSLSGIVDVNAKTLVKAVTRK